MRTLAIMASIIVGFGLGLFGGVLVEMAAGRQDLSGKAAIFGAVALPILVDRLIPRPRPPIDPVR
jgi:hypothetical protein